MTQLQTDIEALSTDSSKDNATGAATDSKAIEYIQKTYKEAGLPPWRSDYLHTFRFTDGKEVSASTRIIVNNEQLQLHEDAFPLPFSACKKESSDILPDVMEQGSIWLFPLYADQDQASDEHFDVEKAIWERSSDALKQGATGVVFFDSYGSTHPLTFNAHSQYTQLSIPVVLLTYKAYQRTIGGPAVKKEGNALSVTLDINVKKADRSGTNVVAYVDNAARYTVVLGAHIGSGDEKAVNGRSGSRTARRMHGQANTDGTAALLELARWVKKNKKLRHFNYVFAAFSGGEPGLFGSKAFMSENAADSAHIAYMVNMDMVGRLGDSANTLIVGGVGSSSAWVGVPDLEHGDLIVAIDSTGVGTSDHTNFYYAGIPVLFFSGAAQKNHEQPGGKAGFINYPAEVQVIKYITRIVAKLDKQQEKPVFTLVKANL